MSDENVKMWKCGNLEMLKYLVGRFVGY